MGSPLIGNNESRLSSQVNDSCIANHQHKLLMLQTMKHNSKALKPAPIHRETETTVKQGNTIQLLVLGRLN